MAVIIILAGVAAFCWKRSRTAREEQEESQEHRGPSAQDNNNTGQYEEIDKSCLKPRPYKSLKMENESIAIDVLSQTDIPTPPFADHHERRKSSDSCGYDRLTFDRMIFVDVKENDAFYDKIQIVAETEI